MTTTSKPQHIHTTIKVTSDVRDRLKAQAKAGGRTLGEQLKFLAKLGERQARLDAMSAAMAATPPELMTTYDDEVEYWDSVNGD